MDRRYEENIVRKRAIGGIGQKKSKMSMHTTAEGGWDRTGVGFELVEAVREGLIGRPMMNPRQHLVLEESVFDTGNSVELHVGMITKLCH